MSKVFIYFALSLLLFSAYSCTQQQEEEVTIVQKADEEIMPDSLLRHVVLFAWNPETPADTIQKIVATFGELPSKIKEIYGYEFGLNNSPEKLNKGLTHCFLVTFTSEADRAVYLPHPDHQAFVTLIEPYVADVLVVDFWGKQ